MRPLTDKELMRRAITGGARTSIHLIKSEAVAQQVADRVWQRVARTPRWAALGRPQLITVMPSLEFAGTWQVRLSLPGIPLASGVPGAQGINKRRSDAIVALMRECFQRTDLVPQWPLNN